MRSNSRASNDLFRAFDGYTRAMTALMSMPARWATDFTSAFEAAACRPQSSSCCDPCPPKCDNSCEEQCGQTSRRVWKGVMVEVSGGRIGKVYKIEDSVVTIDFDGAREKYSRSSICRVVRPALKEGALVRTVFGVIGTIEGYDPNKRFMTLVLSAKGPAIAAAIAAGMGRRGEAPEAAPTDDAASIKIKIDRSAICEVLSPDELSDSEG